MFLPTLGHPLKHLSASLVTLLRHNPDAAALAA
jgi:hypothetical protein